MHRLWAPWRMPYITGLDPEDGPASGGDCFLCAARDTEDDRGALVVLRGTRALALLNRYPYNNGHALVAPHAHKATLAELDDAEALELMTLTRDLTGLLGRAMRPDGFNVGLNLGRAAGAGLPGHLHVHVVPRWNGDTNFMPVLGQTKVIPQALDALWAQLRDAVDAA